MANAGATRLVGLRARRRTVVPDGREGQGMERESIKGVFYRRDIYVFDTRPADADRFLAANKDWGYAARKPKTGPGRLQNGPRPAVADRGGPGSGPQKLTAATDRAAARRKKWSERRDLNPRPLPPQPINSVILACCRV